MLEITKVQLAFPSKQNPQNIKFKCFANIIFNDVFIVKNLRVIEGAKGFFVVMPNTKHTDGSFQDIAHPLSNEFRKVIEDKVLEEYELALKNRKIIT